MALGGLHLQYNVYLGGRMCVCRAIYLSQLQAYAYLNTYRSQIFREDQANSTHGTRESPWQTSQRYPGLLFPRAHPTALNLSGIQM